MRELTLIAFLCALAVMPSAAQQRKPSPDEMRFLSLQYKYEALKIDAQLLADENAALKKELAELKKESK